jgi:glycosyl transferase family 11
MIIVKLMGGLGNQMFQYAFGKRLALKHNTPLKLDQSRLYDVTIKTKYTVRKFGLEEFNINASAASEQELKKYHRGKAGMLRDLVLLHLPFRINNLYVREPYFNFFKKALKAPKDAYLDGYWQSEKYFDNISECLLQDFSLKTALEGENKRLAEKIEKENSVSIHVRRGDYVSMTVNTALFEVCDAEYYLKAIDEMKKLEKQPVLYIFSDEPEWFKQNINTDLQVEYVTHNTGEQSYIDMHLMSLCKHNIIANSSFSWWGAWLNRNPDKKVIAPKKWFKNNLKDARDLIPAQWITL